METKVVEVAVPKEVHELAAGVAEFVVEVMKEIKSNGGWTVGDDLPGLVVASVKLLPALAGATTIGAEVKENIAASLSAIVIGLSPIVGEMSK